MSTSQAPTPRAARLPLSSKDLALFVPPKTARSPAHRRSIVRLDLSGAGGGDYVKGWVPLSAGTEWVPPARKPDAEEIVVTAADWPSVEWPMQQHGSPWTGEGGAPAAPRALFLFKLGCRAEYRASQIGVNTISGSAATAMTLIHPSGTGAPTNRPAANAGIRRRTWARGARRRT